MQNPSSTCMAKECLEKILDLNSLVNTLRGPPFNYSWGTVKNYIVLAGKFVDFIYSERIFTALEQFYTTFKIRYANCIAVCSSRMAENTAKSSKQVFAFQLFMCIMYYICIIPYLHSQRTQMLLDKKTFLEQFVRLDY